MIRLTIISLLLYGLSHIQLIADDISARTFSVKIHFRDAPVDYFGKVIPNNPVREKEFQGFWIKFREAVVNNEWETLSKHVRFPLDTRGSLDSDPIIKVESKDFKKAFSEYLSKSEHLLVIKELETVNPYIVDSWVRIDDMHFERIDQKWKLTWIYLDLREDK